jgi:hypothetical protein
MASIKDLLKRRKQEQALSDDEKPEFDIMNYDIRDQLFDRMDAVLKVSQKLLMPYANEEIRSLVTRYGADIRDQKPIFTVEGDAHEGDLTSVYPKARDALSKRIWAGAYAVQQYSHISEFLKTAKQAFELKCGLPVRGSLDRVEFYMDEEDRDHEPAIPETLVVRYEVFYPEEFDIQCHAVMSELDLCAKEAGYLVVGSTDHMQTQYGTRYKHPDHPEEELAIELFCGDEFDPNDPIRVNAIWVSFEIENE